MQTLNKLNDDENALIDLFVLFNQKYAWTKMLENIQLFSIYIKLLNYYSHIVLFTVQQNPMDKQAETIPMLWRQLSI